MPFSPKRFAAPWLIALLTVGVMVGGLLVGFEPVSGDPDRMYRPLKTELARALGEGRLPFWSDRFGLGGPLLAESHVAALYPLNQVLYRVLDVPAAYRLSMWLHYVALAGATYGYARCLKIKPWGAALAGLSFTFCGFQAIHSSHEPFYHALPFLPLALICTEKFVASGGVVWLALLALTWGIQLTLGHFQIPLWTAGLVVLLGLWRVVADRRPWRRAIGLIVALAWGAAIAALQLVPTWELTQFIGFTRRSIQDRAFFAFPPAHWAELAFPRLFMGLRGGAEDPYWYSQGTTGYEASLYIGTVPLILAFVGLAASRRDRCLTPWKWLVVLSFAMATMPRWWPGGYAALLSVPGLGYFRAPGRYTLLTSLGLCLLAGRGFDRDIEPRRFVLGLSLAVLFGIAASGWAVYWTQHRPDLLKVLGDHGLAWRLGPAAVVWAMALAALAAWRRRVWGEWGPFLLAAAELGVLYYMSTTEWGWAIRLPESSPVLSRLAREPGVVRVAGYLDDLPVRAGLTPAYPYLGMALPPPNRLLEAAKKRQWAADPGAAGWLRRLGVTHGVWDGPVNTAGLDVLYEGPDESLDRLVYREPGGPAHVTWRVVRYSNAFPTAWVARLAFVAPNTPALLERIARSGSAEQAWFLLEDLPPEESGRRAQAARVLRWDGRSGEIEHDGTCDLIVNRTYYPGWLVRVDEGPERPVTRANGGLQSVRLTGAGVSRVSVRYDPSMLRPAAAVSALATAMALLVIAIAVARRRPGPEHGEGPDAAEVTDPSASVPR